jgi:ribonuclease D
MIERVYIERDADLADLCRALTDAEWLGLDTEFLREKTWYPRLCLLQLASETHLACIDPLAIGDLSPLKTLLSAPGIVKIFHAARQDIEVLSQTPGVIPGPLFDTQLAAAFCGWGDQLGYAALVGEIAGVKLAKAHTRTDWSRRPISDGALDYAFDDVRYLGAIHGHLDQQLEKLDRRDWFNDEISRLTDPALYQAAPEKAWRGVRGRQRIDDDAARGALKALAAWRERRAMKKNRPRRWIASDDTLVGLANESPGTTREMKRIAGTRGLVKAGQGERLISIIAAGRGRPQPLAENAPLTAEKRALLKRLSGMLRDRAGEMQLSPSLLANRKQLEQLATGGRDLPVLSGWRYRIVGEALLAEANASGTASCRSGST